MLVCPHTYIHTRMHTRIYTHTTLTCAHTYTKIRILTCAHTAAQYDAHALAAAPPSAGGLGFCVCHPVGCENVNMFYLIYSALVSSPCA